MKKKDDPKRPSDYKTLRIRLPQDLDVSKIMRKVQKVRTLKNKDLPEDEKVWRKNHVLLEALEIGLRELGG